MRILVVDDSRAMRMIVIRSLRQAGYRDAEIVEASNGVEALEVIRSSPPDVVLSDWNMPDMSGIELLRSVNAEGIAVPFGFVTSESTPPMRKQALEEGALFLLAKPFTAEALEEALGAVVG
ncbi:MAG: response regulator [Actinomycetota bacterium]|nr:MAG: response regulator [Actinomycetota bacterium]